MPGLATLAHTVFNENVMLGRFLFSGRRPLRFRGVLGALVGILALVGTVCLLLQGIETARFWRRHGLRWPGVGGVPNSLWLGLPRDEDGADFQLNERNSHSMRPRRVPETERWADVAGNYYHADFIARYLTALGREDGPRVRVRWEPRGRTFRGRIEARGLKPNFAYQVKLAGVFSRDPESAERIGFLGRWRLPVPEGQTNFTDREYRGFAPREQVESYLLFDFFVTDRHGNAVRDLELDGSAHVLWNRDRQHEPDVPGHAVGFRVEADDPAIYARPKNRPTTEFLWAEREHRRYRRKGQAIRLPPGTYRVDLVLTEESFHSRDRDGGFWATVFRLPITFEIVEVAAKAPIS